jgi:SAM-dependent methyltransferase
MKHAESFFDFAAQVGITKHLGGQDATKELVDRCRITPLSYVLDVGCGVGVTSCYLAKSIGCRVVGVDLNPNMVERSRERAEREKISHLLEFRTADIQDLPFPDETFNAVISESVSAFPEDKNQAIREYVRVTKPGGFIGLNEGTWLQTPVPSEIIAWAFQDLGAEAKPLPPEEWIALLEGAGLTGVFSRTSTISTREESRGILERYGWSGFLNSMIRAFGLYLRNPDYREYVQSIGKAGIKPPNLEEYFGYGIYIGKKELFDEEN